MRVPTRHLSLTLSQPQCGCSFLKTWVSSLFPIHFILGLYSLIFLIIMFCHPDCFVSTLKTYNLAIFLSSLYLVYCLVCRDFQGYLLLLILKCVICKVILFPGYCQNCPRRVRMVEDTNPAVRGLNRTRGGKCSPIQRSRNHLSACPNGHCFYSLLLSLISLSTHPPI